MTRRMLGAILASAAAGHAADVPRKAGDIAITLPNGRKVKPQDFAGKILSLSFILTT